MPRVRVRISVVMAGSFRGLPRMCPGLARPITRGAKGHVDGRRSRRAGEAPDAQSGASRKGQSSYAYRRRRDAHRSTCKQIGFGGFGDVGQDDGELIAA